MPTLAITILAAGLAITGTLLQAPATAEAKTHRVQTVKADVDGDGRGDVIKVYRLANKSKYRATYKIIAKTAKGKRAARILTMTGSAETGRITKPLITVAPLDGQAGSELVIKTTARTKGEWGSFSYTILTLRKGKLVKEASPTGSWRTGFSGSEGYSSSSWLVFDQVDGGNSSLVCTSSEIYGPPTVYGYSMTASAWSDGKWQPGVQTLVNDPRCSPEAGSASVTIKP
jgi:hypothetical protein